MHILIIGSDYKELIKIIEDTIIKRKRKPNEFIRCGKDSSNIHTYISYTVEQMHGTGLTGLRCDKIIVSDTVKDPEQYLLYCSESILPLTVENLLHIEGETK